MTMPLRFWRCVGCGAVLSMPVGEHPHHHCPMQPPTSQVVELEEVSIQVGDD